MRQGLITKQTFEPPPNMLRKIATSILVTKWINRFAVVVMLLCVYAIGYDSGRGTSQSQACNRLPQ